MSSTVPMNTLPLFAVARKGDPDTSKDAAVSANRHIHSSRLLVLTVLATLGEATDVTLCDALAGRLAPSGARTRRSELVAMGMARWTGRKETLPSGCLSMVWAVTEEGLAFLRSSAGEPSDG